MKRRLHLSPNPQRLSVPLHCPLTNALIASRPQQPRTPCLRFTPKTNMRTMSPLIMAKPESNLRRNALAHLRAAVAATIADKSQGKDDKDST